MNLHAPRCLFTIEAERDPFVPTRILAFATVCNELPRWFSVLITGENTVRIILELEACDHDSADRLAKRIASIPTVIDVSRTWMSRRTQTVP